MDQNHAGHTLKEEGVQRVLEVPKVVTDGDARHGHELRPTQDMNKKAPENELRLARHIPQEFIPSSSTWVHGYMSVRLCLPNEHVAVKYGYTRTVPASHSFSNRALSGSCRSATTMSFRMPVDSNRQEMTHQEYMRFR